jgi:hypothetical protein
MTLTAFLVTLIVVAIIVYAISLVLGTLAIPQPIKTLVWLVVAVIVIVYLLNLLGVGVGTTPLIR